jgi:hypothetical protein
MEVNLVFKCVPTLVRPVMMTFKTTLREPVWLMVLNGASVRGAGAEQVEGFTALTTPAFTSLM